MNIIELKDSEKIRVQEKIKELRDSDGWDIIKQIMEEEISTFIRKMASPDSRVDRDTINYNRGVIEGSYRLKSLPDTIITQIEAALQINASKQQTATAVTK